MMLLKRLQESRVWRKVPDRRFQGRLPLLLVVEGLGVGGTSMAFPVSTASS